jgi:hypothetical protein
MGQTGGTISDFNMYKSSSPEGIWLAGIPGGIELEYGFIPDIEVEYGFIPVIDLEVLNESALGLFTCDEFPV